MRILNTPIVQSGKQLFALIVLAFFISTGGYAQYDYFHWAKTQSYSTGFNPKSTGSGMAVDQYDRAFYVANTGSANRVSWLYGDLLGSAPAAASLSNLVFVADNAGDHLLYVNANNKIAMTEYLYANSAWSSNSAYAITEVVAQGPSIAAINTNNVYYIRASDKQVCNLYTVGNTLYYASLNTSLPAAANLSNLEINNGRIFYIKSTRTLGCLQWSSVTNNWASVALPNAPAANSIATGSRIRVNGSGTSFNVFYVGSDQRIHQYYSNPSVSGNVLVSSEGPLVQYMSDISMYSYDEINYVGQDGNVHCLYYTGCDWAYYKLNSTCSIADGAIARGTTNKIFFYSTLGIQKIEDQSTSSGFVYRKHNKLALNGAPFNPIGINYKSMINSTNNGSSFFYGPNPHYAAYLQPWYTTKAACLQAMDQDLAEIASLGFNSIRFNDLHLQTNRADSSDANLYVHYIHPLNNGTTLSKQLDQATVDSLFVMYDSLLLRCAAHNLKVKFFIGLENGNRSTATLPAYNTYLQQFANHFKNNPTIYSFAVLQEGDNNGVVNSDVNVYPYAYRGKGDICYQVENMYNSIRSVDQNHLVNLSITGSVGVYNFDPAILKVDFVSFHPYPTDATFERVKTEIQWMSNIMRPLGKPWIIGETGFSGSNTNPPLQGTGSYSDQKNYAQFVLDEAFSAGASGVCWWQYKEIYWPADVGSVCCPDPTLGSFFPGTQYWNNTENYYGIKSHTGILKPLVGGPGLTPTSNVFLNYSPQMGCTPMYPPSNYYSVNTLAPYSYSGLVQNASAQGLKDAKIQAFNYNPTTSVTTDLGGTFTQANGAFTIYSSLPVTQYMVSAPGYAYAYRYVSQGTTVLNQVVCGQGNARMANGISELQAKESNANFSVFPNPNHGVFTLKNEKGSSGKVTLVISDLTGRSLLKKELVNVQADRIDMSTFANGIYLIHITSGTLTETKKVIIE